MKFLIITLLITVAGFTVKAQTTTLVKADTLRIVEAACGQCRFGMKGDGCNLAVKINGLPYFVDGSKIDDHGDAHADDGFCNKIRKAKVNGSIVNERFVASSFKLLPEEKAKQ